MTKRLPFLDWYRILRVHHQWPVLEAIRYAMWLTRSNEDIRLNDPKRVK